MSSDSSDSEGGREGRRRSDNSDSRPPASPPPEDAPKLSDMPGSPVSGRSLSLSPEGPRSPSSPPPSRSGSPSNSGSAARSEDRTKSSPPSRKSKSRSRSAARSKSRSPSNSRSAARSKSPDSIRSKSPSESRSPSPAPKRGPRSPPTNFDDDGRSNISSGSSILSQGSLKASKMNGESKSPSKVPFSVPNAEDLSDVSDIGEDDLGSPKERDGRRDRRDTRDSHREDDDGEQLDFEVEDQGDGEKEDGECEQSAVHQDKEDNREPGEDKASGDDGECKEEEEEVESLEEGEVSDDGDPKPEKPPICRFYSRGACTWGNNCRFLHPGVTDKGNYSMFESARPIVAGNGLGLYPPETRPYPLLLPPSRVLAGAYGPVGGLVRREDAAAVESAWERGLRQAKELMRISTKRKESDMDFEEKKMNMSIGQEEMDKENDYYTRVASPPEADPWAARLSPRREEGDVRRPVRVVERYEDIIPDPISPGYERYDHRRAPRDPQYLPRREKYYPEDEPRKSKKMVREVIVQRGEKSSKRVAPDGRADGRKPDEWQDPWMRARSPGGSKHRPRKISYSSGSSSYSGSSSRSSSNSSYSSYSRSRSGSRSGSGSRSPVSRRRPRSPPPAGIPVRPKNFDPKFKPLKTVTPAEKGAERPLLMNPPAPFPVRNKRPLTPTTAIKKVGLNPPAPTTKSRSQPKRRKSGRKSRSSSSGSSGSSSESSHSTYSSDSSSSSKPKSPPSRKKDAEERLKNKLQRAKAKTDKAAASVTLAGKKRPAEDAPPPPKDLSPGSGKGGSGKKGSSRREELLKQLKAVEDAIARKRSKI